MNLDESTGGFMDMNETKEFADYMCFSACSKLYNLV